MFLRPVSKPQPAGSGRCAARRSEAKRSERPPLSLQSFPSGRGARAEPCSTRHAETPHAPAHRGLAPDHAPPSQQEPQVLLRPGAGAARTRVAPRARFAHAAAQDARSPTPLCSWDRRTGPTATSPAPSSGCNAPAEPGRPHLTPRRTRNAGAGSNRTAPLSPSAPRCPQALSAPCTGTSTFLVL